MTSKCYLLSDEAIISNISLGIQLFSGPEKSLENSLTGKRRGEGGGILSQLISPILAE